MFGKYKMFYHRYQNLFSGLFLFIVIIIWILGPILARVNMFSTEVAFGISFSIIILIMGIILNYLNKLQSKSEIYVFKDQATNNLYLADYIRSNRIKEARLIEYDGASIMPLINELLNIDAEVYLLLQHPESAISEYQRKKIIHQIQVKDYEYPNLSRLHIDYYKDIASIRARKFDNKILNIGWYTYDRRKTKDVPEVWGHNNPVILFSLENPENKAVEEMFDTVFHNLLSNSESYDSLKEKYNA